MLLAEHIAVMQDGRLMEHGPPRRQGDRLAALKAGGDGRSGDA